MGDAPSPPAPETRSTRTLVTGAKFDYEEMTLAGPDGREFTRHHIRHPGAVCILPLLSTDRGPSVLFAKNFRAAVGEWVLELPAGTIEAGEPPERCAARELVEETGYSADTLTPLGQFYTSPGLSDEAMWAFVATGLAFVGQDLDADEHLVVEEHPLAEALAMVSRGEMTDAKSMLTLLLARTRGLLGEPQA